MYRLSIIINEIYLKYLPLAAKAGLTLNLDFPDTTIQVQDGEKIKKDVEKTIRSALSKSIKGEITIAVSKGKIVITDTGTVLSKTLINMLENDHIEIKSRVGFGTVVTIKF